MVILALATGLRCSELFGLKWCDVLWDELTLLVRRAIVTGVENEVKTNTPMQECRLTLCWPRCS